MFYTGRNRNYTDITENALNKLVSRKGYANVPVVAHLYKGEDGKWRVGGHDSKLVWDSDDNIEIIDETVPFGVVPEDCNPAVESVTERSGAVRKYFCVDVILWTHRYNIMDAAAGDDIYFNQSMEITFSDWRYDDDGYCVIDDFSLSALCLLNHDVRDREKNVEPCFESAAVSRFSLDKLKAEFELMREKLKFYERGGKTLNTEKIKSSLDGKFFVLSASENSALVMAKESFEVFSIPFSVSGEDIVFDYANAEKKVLCVAADGEDIIAGAIKEYVDVVKSDIVAGMDKTYSQKYEAEKAAAVKDIANKLVEANAQIGALTAAREQDAKVIEGYKAAEKKAAEDKHREEIDAVVAKYSERFYEVPDLFVYKSNIDYSKTPEQVEQDIFVILGKQASAGGVGGKASFSAASWGARGGLDSSAKGSNGRYGDLFDKFGD